MADELHVKITAEDQASKVIEKVTKKANKLDGETAEVTVEAKVSKALSALDDVAKEAKQAEAAAEALSKALGPQLAAGADLDRIVGEFERMGLSLDEITANADQLGAKLREVGDASTGGLESSFRRAKAASDDLGKSAGSSKSVLANMVGNSAQDLGALGGLAGGAGVAIGQMGEYMADAAADGEGLTSILTSFSAVAGPIAALGLAMQVVNDAMALRAKSTQAETDSIKAMTDAMADGGDAVADYAQSLEDAGEIQGRFGKATTDDLGGIGSLAANMPSLGAVFLRGAAALGVFGKKTDDLVDDFDKAGISATVWSEAVAGGADGLEKMRKGLALTNLSADEQRKILESLANAQKDWTAATDNSSKIQAVFNDRASQTKEHVEAVTQAYKDAADPQATYNRLQEEGAEQAERINAILEDWAQKQADVAKAVGDTTTQWAAMSDEVSEKSFQEALEQINSLSELDLAQMRQDTVASFDDVKDAIGKAAEGVKNWGKLDLTPDSFEELRGMPDELGAVTDAVSGMRQAIQNELQLAFDTDGVKGFTDKFDFFTGQVREQFTAMFRGMGLPEDQVKKQVDAMLADLSLLPKTKEIVITVTREKELANTLDIFKSKIDAIEQAEPSVDISTKWAEGDLQGALDELNAVRINLEQDPIVLPTDVDRFGAETAAREARDRAQVIIAANPVKFNSTVLSPPKSATDKAVRDAQTALNGKSVTIPVNLGNGKFRLPNGQVVFDSGGNVGPAGGIVAERRPEIINSRFLATQPTLVPPGTRVTSGARTARILRHGTRGLKRYDQGGTVTGGVRNVTVNLHAGVIGNQFDVMRAVIRAEKQAERLLGTRR